MSSPAQPTREDLQAEAIAQDVAAEMPSPYCPGRSIASCPSSYARELEEDILELAKEGKDREEIEVVLVDRFGEAKMGKPHQSGLLVALGIAALIALTLIVTAARRWLRPTNTNVAGHAGPKARPITPLANVSADELDRLEDELDELDGI